MKTWRLTMERQINLLLYVASARRPVGLPEILRLDEFAAYSEPTPSSGVRRFERDKAMLAKSGASLVYSVLERGYTLVTPIKPNTKTKLGQALDLVGRVAALGPQVVMDLARLYGVTDDWNFKRDIMAIGMCGIPPLDPGRMIEIDHEPERIDGRAAWQYSVVRLHSDQGLGRLIAI